MINILNKVLQYIGLRIVNARYYDELLRKRYEHLFMAYRIEQLEEELEEWRVPTPTEPTPLVTDEARRQFLDDTVDDAEYNAYLEWLHTPKASEY